MSSSETEFNYSDGFGFKDKLKVSGNESVSSSDNSDGLPEV